MITVNIVDGGVEIGHRVYATQAEVDAGTINNKAVSPLTLANYSGLSASISAATQSQVNTGTATGVYVDPAKLQDKNDDAVALIDAATIDITGPKHTLTSSTGRTFTISHTGDDMVIELTLNATSATFTFPAGTKCWSQGVASGTNTMALSGTSADVYIIGIWKIGSNYYAASNNAYR